jgi:hypothetical protein
MRHSAVARATIVAAILAGPAAGAAQPGNAALAPPSDSQARAIVDRHEKAIGQPGKPFKYSHTIVEMRFSDSVATRTETYRRPPNKILMVVTVPGMRPTRTGYDGKVGWSISPLTGIVILEGEPLDSLRALSAVQTQHTIDKTFSLSSLGPDTIAGRRVNAVLVVRAKRDTLTFFFDDESGLMAGMRVLRQGGQAADSPALMLFSDYKRLDGVFMPTKLTVRFRGRDVVTETVHFDTRPIHDSTFALPAAVRAVLARRP